MKTKLMILLPLGFVGVVMAIITGPFNGWDEVMRTSPDIIIVHCNKTPEISYKGMVHSDVEVISTLKGTSSLGPAQLRSLYWPRQGENYLIFAHYHSGSYQAIEEYRMMPLGIELFPAVTNSIAGKPLNEQLEILFKHRLWLLNRELEQGQEEKKRLEEALKK